MKKHAKPPRVDAARALEVALARLEVASGYDGLLRGAPEPVVVVAAYAISAAQPPITVLRGTFRVRVPNARFPLVTTSVGVGVVPRPRAVPVGAEVLLVAAGIEDDGGDGTARVFGALERAGEIAIASVELGEDVETLAEIGREASQAWRQPTRARVIVDGLPLETRVAKDDWVGAAAVRFAERETLALAGPAAGRSTLEHRLHLASDDFVNDWTAVVTSRFG